MQENQKLLGSFGLRLNSRDEAWLENYVVERDELLQGFEAEKMAVLELKHMCIFFGLLDEEGELTALATSKEDRALKIVMDEDVPMIPDHDERTDPMDCDSSITDGDNSMNQSELPQASESMLSTPGPFSPRIQSQRHHSCLSCQRSFSRESLLK